LAALAVLAVLVSAASPSAALAADPPLCQPPASISNLGGTFPGAPLVALNRPPDLQVAMIGQTGSWEGHVVFQPRPSPPPALSDGCQENSRFTITGFTGTLVMSGTVASDLFGFSPVIVTATQPTDASLQVHFGTQSSRPLLTFRSKTPVNTIFGPVRMLQIVGGQVVHAK
jgi:hypothetical protein